MAGGPTLAGYASAPKNARGAATLKIGGTDSGSVLRLEGAGTMAQSPSVLEFVSRHLKDSTHSLVLDLTGCTYLDSTFLGCIVKLNREFGSSRPPRFTVAVGATETRKLFGPTRLDRVLNLCDASPASREWIDMPTPPTADAREIALHVMQCHRLLAQVQGPFQAVFARIADEMEKGLK